MQIREFLPSRGCFTLGEKVIFNIKVETETEKSAVLAVDIHHLDETPTRIVTPLRLKESLTYQVAWQPPREPAGYGAQAILFDDLGNVISEATTSFDVLPAWSAFPRYGFLTDFSPNRPDPDGTIEKLSQFHINGLQFYDWQFKHDELLAPTEEYIDPLGRKMCLATIRRLVKAAGKHGMASMPYLAVYAASAKFWREHLAEALYDEKGQPIPFGEDFLGLMNPEEGSAWREHLLNECKRTLSEIPFSGLHIDQYGEPKEVWNASGKRVDLPEAFSTFIRGARSQHPEKTILFNAVGNWPIETLAATTLDFMYIEIWPPDVHYQDVARIVMDAVRLSLGKPVVIAVYLPADRAENVMQVNAVISACGGSRIELGEDVRLLADPYFPKHQEILPSLKTALVKYYDFRVRYGEWLQGYQLRPAERQVWAQAEFRPDFVVSSPEVWAIARKLPDGMVINLVNFSGQGNNSRWDERHEAPAECQDLKIRIAADKKPEKILWACPEAVEGPSALDFEYDHGQVSISLPSLNLLGVIYLYE